MVPARRVLAAAKNVLDRSTRGAGSVVTPALACVLKVQGASGDESVRFEDDAEGARNAVRESAPPQNEAPAERLKADSPPDAAEDVSPDAADRSEADAMPLSALDIAARVAVSAAALAAVVFEATITFETTPRSD